MFLHTIVIPITYEHSANEVKQAKVVTKVRKFYIKIPFTIFKVVSSLANSIHKRKNSNKTNIKEKALKVNVYSVLRGEIVQCRRKLIKK